MTNLHNLMMLFEETPEKPTNGWLTWVIMGLMVVAVILMMIIPQRKNKKRAEQMMTQLRVGSRITTIGGIVGDVVELDQQHIWINTGLEGSKQTMQFLRAAIHSIEPEAGTSEAAAKIKQESDNEVDEIK